MRLQALDADSSLFMPNFRPVRGDLCANRIAVNTA